jgi:hypothetical protein
MTDNPADKTPEAIKKHQQKQTFEYKGPGGSAIREAEANRQVEKDRERFSGNRAEKYANIEKEKIATRSDVEKGTRGNLSKQYNKSGKEMEG